MGGLSLIHLILAAIIIAIVIAVVVAVVAAVVAVISALTRTRNNSLSGKEKGARLELRADRLARTTAGLEGGQRTEAFGGCMPPVGIAEGNGRLAAATLIPHRSGAQLRQVRVASPLLIPFNSFGTS